MYLLTCYRTNDFFSHIPPGFPECAVCRWKCPGRIGRWARGGATGLALHLLLHPMRWLDGGIDSRLSFFCLGRFCSLHERVCGRVFAWFPRVLISLHIIQAYAHLQKVTFRTWCWSCEWFHLRFHLHLVHDKDQLNGCLVPTDLYGVATIHSNVSFTALSEAATRQTTIPRYSKTNVFTRNGLI